jgi:hypothetical protein
MASRGFVQAFLLIAEVLECDDSDGGQDDNAGDRGQRRHADGAGHGAIGAA